MNVPRRSRVPPALAALALSAAASSASAQTTPGALDSTAQTTTVALPVGAEVVDARGNGIGRIAHLLPGPDGRPSQVLLRTGGIAGVRSSLKALPAAVLVRREDAVVAPITREELQSLPDVDAPEPTSPA